MAESGVDDIGKVANNAKSMSSIIFTFTEKWKNIGKSLNPAIIDAQRVPVLARIFITLSLFERQTKSYSVHQRRILSLLLFHYSASYVTQLRAMNVSGI